MLNRNPHSVCSGLTIATIVPSTVRLPCHIAYVNWPMHSMARLHQLSDDGCTIYYVIYNQVSTARVSEAAFIHTTYKE